VSLPNGLDFAGDYALLEARYHHHPRVGRSAGFDVVIPRDPPRCPAIVSPTTARSSGPGNPKCSQAGARGRYEAPAIGSTGSGEAWKSVARYEPSSWSTQTIET